MPFQIIRNDITKMHVDAIVNTANPHPIIGRGTDSAVYEAAGAEELLAARKEIGEIEPGQSAITAGFKLLARYIFHTVGVTWQGGDAGEEDVIRSCYRTVFGLAEEKGVESLAIPLLASGSYGFPKGVALRIALSEIESFMKEGDIDLYLVVFDEKAFALSTELYGDIDEYINSNYVEEQTIHEYSQPNEEWVFAASSMEDADIEIPAATYSAPMPSRSLDDVIMNLDKTFMELVFSFADAKGMTDVEVQKKANLDRKAFSKLKCGTTKNPSKSTALALAIALELNLDETRDLLSRAGLALSPCSRQDLIVQYFIEREAYDIYEINIALFEHGEPGLGSLAKE